MISINRFTGWLAYWSIALAVSVGLAALLLTLTNHTAPSWLAGHYPTSPYLASWLLSVYQWEALGIGLVVGLVGFVWLACRRAGI